MNKFITLVATIFLIHGFPPGCTSAQATYFGKPVSVKNGGTGQTTYAQGELLIGKADGTLGKATLTAGANVTITDGDGTVEIAAAGGGGGGGTTVYVSKTANDEGDVTTFAQNPSFITNTTWISTGRVDLMVNIFTAPFTGVCNCEVINEVSNPTNAYTCRTNDNSNGTDFWVEVETKVNGTLTDLSFSLMCIPIPAP
jgi:hypothetical protein